MISIDSVTARQLIHMLASHALSSSSLHDGQVKLYCLTASQATVGRTYTAGNCVDVEAGMATARYCKFTKIRAVSWGSSHRHRERTSAMHLQSSVDLLTCHDSSKVCRDPDSHEVPASVSPNHVSHGSFSVFCRTRALVLADHVVSSVKHDPKA